MWSIRLESLYMFFLSMTNRTQIKHTSDSIGRIKTLRAHNDEPHYCTVGGGGGGAGQASSSSSWTLIVYIAPSFIRPPAAGHCSDKRTTFSCFTEYKTQTVNYGEKGHEQIWIRDERLRHLGKSDKSVFPWDSKKSNRIPPASSSIVPPFFSFSLSSEWPKISFPARHEAAPDLLAGWQAVELFPQCICPTGGRVFIGLGLVQEPAPFSGCLSAHEGIKAIGKAN